jgi:hypothetical protein
MEASLITGICIILGVLGVVVWLPLIVFFPVIKSIADRIAGKSSQVAQITTLQQKVILLEAEVSDLKARQLLIEDSQHFAQQFSQTSQPKDK